MVELSSSSDLASCTQSAFIPQHITDSCFLSRERVSGREKRERKWEGKRRGCSSGKQGLGAVWLVTRAEREREREVGDGERCGVFLLCAVLRGFEEDLAPERSERSLFMTHHSPEPLA